MRDLTVDQWINFSASGFTALACITFAALYHRRVTWWRSAIGRNLMGLAAAIGVLCAYTVLITLAPDGCLSVILRGIRTCMVLTVGGIMIQQTRLLLKAQREHRSAD
ncbi:hypothetical protein KVH31_13755 [Streptomyces olivaceus]|uniref:putative phage holin n=1 Tax=Streptomyces olivaceus TaxID=47716 RepID=UPI001CC97A8D|nr:hypothetical protein [Streptomyces olivaceus]MBZ6207565.1 hypothetical protein [Streptomyces olivaceus]